MAELITTTKGLMDPDHLEKRTGVVDNDKERTEWVEYWDDGELVHRSVNMHLKTGVFGAGFAGSFA